MNVEIQPGGGSLVQDHVKVTVYRWAGKKWFFRIDGECILCDLAVSQVRHFMSLYKDWPVELEVKPWLTHLWESLRHGGWHAPVVVVDGQLVRQGTIPTRAEFDGAVHRALQRHGITLAHVGIHPNFREEVSR